MYRTVAFVLYGGQIEYLERASSHLGAGQTNSRSAVLRTILDEFMRQNPDPEATFVPASPAAGPTLAKPPREGE
jgi:hypothetical protein